MNNDVRQKEKEEGKATKKKSRKKNKIGFRAYMIRESLEYF